MSTFYSDGYQDAMAGRPQSPPDHPETDVYAQEYLEGYGDFGRGFSDEDMQNAEQIYSNRGKNGH